MQSPSSHRFAINDPRRHFHHSAILGGHQRSLVQKADGKDPKSTALHNTPRYLLLFMESADLFRKPFPPASRSKAAKGPKHHHHQKGFDSSSGWIGRRRRRRETARTDLPFTTGQKPPPPSSATTGESAKRIVQSQAWPKEKPPAAAQQRFPA